jgi:hypothetical protein
MCVEIAIASWLPRRGLAFFTAFCGGLLQEASIGCQLWFPKAVGTAAFATVDMMR